MKAERDASYIADETEADSGEEPGAKEKATSRGSCQLQRMRMG